MCIYLWKYFMHLKLYSPVQEGWVWPNQMRFWRRKAIWRPNFCRSCGSELEAPQQCVSNGAALVWDRTALTRQSVPVVGGDDAGSCHPQEGSLEEVAIVERFPIAWPLVRSSFLCGGGGMSPLIPKDLKVPQ